jgi:hypothetical protein
MAISSFTMINALKLLLQKHYSNQVIDLPPDESGRVGKTQNGTDNEYSKTCAHVWGANSLNYNLPLGRHFGGGNQAKAFTNLPSGIKETWGDKDNVNPNKIIDFPSIQTPGVFGIISTPSGLVNDLQNVLRKKLKWPGIDDADYIILYNALKTFIVCNNIKSIDIHDIHKILISQISDYETLIKKALNVHLEKYTKGTPQNKKSFNRIEISLSNTKMIIVKIHDHYNKKFYYFENHDKYLQLDISKIKEQCQYVKSDNESNITSVASVGNLDIGSNGSPKITAENESIASEGSVNRMLDENASEIESDLLHSEYEKFAVSQYYFFNFEDLERCIIPSTEFDVEDDTEIETAGDSALIASAAILTQSII